MAAIDKKLRGATGNRTGRQSPVVAMLVGMLLLSGCGFGAFGDDPELPLAPQVIGLNSGPETGGEYRLGSGDRVQVNVFGHPDLSGEFEVDGNGLIAYPLIGQVQAGGHTVEELQGVIAVDLDRDFVVDPRISIEVLNFRPFFILGQVNQPGSYPFISGLNVRQAVAIAGGFTRRANQTQVIIVRDTEAGEMRFRATPNAAILPGDTVDVPRRLF